MTALDLDGMLKRLHLPTVRRLYPECELRAEAEDQSYRDFLAMLIAEEVAHRAQTRIERSVRKAHFPFLRTIEEFDFTFQTSVRLQLLGSYLGPELVTEGRSLILCGPSGTGKTHLGIAVAYRAIQNGFEVLFTSAAEMLERLSVASRSGDVAYALVEYTHPAVLVIDEIGYLTVGGDAANLLFQVVNERYLHHRPMLFTTNKPLAAWGLVLHDPDLAEAIIDRVLERGRLVELRGASYRTRHLKRADSDRSPLREGAIISGNQGPEFPEPTVLKPVDSTPAPIGHTLVVPVSAHTEVAPASPGRFTLQLTMGQDTHKLLCEARELLGHAVPSGDVEAVLQRALRELVKQLSKRKFADAAKPHSERDGRGEPCINNTRHIPASGPA